jgi:RNA-directed DNA polymerase
MLERAKETTRYGKYTYIEYARFADDLVILIDAHPRHDWLMGAVEKRLREELAELQVEIMKRRVGSQTLAEARASAFWDSTSDVSAVVGACGVRNTHPSSRNERRCCGSSRMYSAASNRNLWIGSLR